MIIAGSQAEDASGVKSPTSSEKRDGDQKGGYTQRIKAGAKTTRRLRQEIQKKS